MSFLFTVVRKQLTVLKIAYTILMDNSMKLSISHQQMVSSIAANCISVRLRLLNRMVGAVYDGALRPHGIKASQLNILVAVSTTGGATSRELCQVLHMDSSTFSRAVTRMKKKGWLRVDPSGEGKILKIQVTREGLNKIEVAYPDWQRAQTEVKEMLGESTAAVVVDSGSKQLMKGMAR